MTAEVRWPGAALYESTVRHTRVSPIRHGFVYRTYYWYVDVDRLPRARWPMRWLLGFESADHGDRQSSRRQPRCGQPTSIRAGIDRFLAEHGIDLTGGSVTMLAHARVLGFVFNPLTMFWCHRADGSPACAIAQVHNTYGGRHRYLLHPDDRDLAQATKALYVSPFNPVDGDYRLHVPEPTSHLDLGVSLTRPDGSIFRASVAGHRRPATYRNLLALAFRHPVTPLAGALRIRWQGLRLWRRGLPVVPRDAPVPHSLPVR